MIFRTLAFLAVFVTASNTRAETIDEKVLSWRDEVKGNHLVINGSIVTDMVIFPRVETGYGKSWHVGPSLREVRIGSDFQLSKVWGGRLDIELSSLDPIRMDMWAEYRALDFLRIRVGRFKIPFGLIQQLGVCEQPLLETPMVIGNPKDFRDTGLMLLGEIWGKRVTYGVAVVTGSRDRAVDVNEKPDIVGSLRVYPFRELGSWFENLGFGTSVSWGLGPLRKGFRGRTMANWTFVNPPSIRGEQLRWGADFEWAMDRVNVRAEYMWQRQVRDSLEDLQLVNGTMMEVGDLEPWVVHGFYTDLKVHVWGKRQGLKPITGVEIVSRFESMHFGDGSHLETIPEGEVDRAPLPDSQIQGVSVGVHGYLGWGVRLTVLYQGLRFGVRALSPDYDSSAIPDQDPEEKGHWVNHFFARAQWVY